MSDVGAEGPEERAVQAGAAPAATRVPSGRAARGRRRAVASLIAAAFLADVVLGAISPVFPLFAKRLGASTAELAALVTAGGLASLLLGVPAARLADRLGKPAVLAGGLSLYGLSGLVLALGGGVPLLVLPQLMMGTALVCTFTVGLACISDLVSGAARARAVGFYTAAMGAGYGVGPLISGWSVSGVGFRATFAAFGLLGGVSAASVWANLRGIPRSSHRERALLASGGLRLLRRGGAREGGAREGGAREGGAREGGAREGGAREGAPAGGAPVAATAGAMWELRRRMPSGFVLLASFVNLPTTLAINVGILTFFPVYAAALHWSTTVIGFVLFGRATASAVARLGMRVIDAMSISPLVLIRATLGVETSVLVLLAWSHSLGLTVLLLAIEGVNYGITMSLAQLSIVSSADSSSSASSLVWWNGASSVAQLGGGGLVALLVGGYSARTAILIVGLICCVLWFAFIGLSLWRAGRQRRAGRAGTLAGAGSQLATGAGVT